MNKILVPVDFSETSLNALQYAIKLFGGSEVEITVLHTYEIISSAFYMKSIDRVFEETAQSEMDTLINKIRDEDSDVVLKPKILKSNPVSAIISQGNKGAYDYIIMGTKGASGLKEVFIGSVAGGVISKTSIPVLIVPGNYHYRPIKKIVFAVDGIPFSGPTVVEPLREITKMWSCKINVLNLNEGETPDLEEMLKTIDDLNPTVTYSTSAGNINKRLSNYMNEVNADLLCLVRRNRGFFNRIFGESVTLKQTFNSPVPLFILNN